MSCVNCGFCCRIAPCPYGDVTSPTDRACRFLVPGPKPGRWLCGKYNEIILDQPNASMVPAFGAGCCCSMCNPDRNRILQEIMEDIKEEHAESSQDVVAT